MELNQFPSGESTKRAKAASYLADELAGLYSGEPNPSPIVGGRRRDGFFAAPASVWRGYSKSMALTKQSRYFPHGMEFAKTIELSVRAGAVRGGRRVATR